MSLIVPTEEDLLSGAASNLFYDSVKLLYTISGSAFRRLASANNSERHKRLCQFPDLFPAVAVDEFAIEFREDRFLNAMEEFTKNNNPLAAFDLFYMKEQAYLNLSKGCDQAYRKFTAKYRISNDAILKGMEVNKLKKSEIEGTLERIKNLSATPPLKYSEIVIHNAINPLRSITFIANRITPRNVNDPCTAFILNKMLAYGEQLNNHSTTFKLNGISNKLRKNMCGDEIYATTIPLFLRNDLLGFLCINCPAIVVQSLESNAKVKKIFSQYI